MNVNKRQAV